MPFSKSSALDTNIITHTKEAIYEFIQSSEPFSESGTIDTNIKTHTEEATYECTE